MKGSKPFVSVLGDVQPCVLIREAGTNRISREQDTILCTNRTCFSSLQSRMEINMASLCFCLTPVNSKRCPYNPKHCYSVN